MGGACEYDLEVFGLGKRVFGILLAAGRTLHCSADLGIVDLVARRRREVEILEGFIVGDLVYGFECWWRSVIELG